MDTEFIMRLCRLSLFKSFELGPKVNIHRVMIPMVLNHKPDVSLNDAERFVNENWNFLSPIKLTELNSYDSRTYIVDSFNGNRRFIFKISNAIESRDVRYFECISLILHHLTLNNIGAQQLISASNGKEFLDFYEDSSKQVNVLKSVLLSYIEGDVLVNKIISGNLCFLLGQQLSKLTMIVDEISSKLNYLEEFTCESIWNMKNSSRIRNFIPYFNDPIKQDLLTRAVDEFDEKVAKNFQKLTRGFIHGDPNDMNIIVKDEGQIFFIDWQDCSIGFKIYDLAILIFSLMSITMTSSHPLDFEDVGKQCLAGYLHDDPHCLNEMDISLLPVIVQTRVALSVSVGYYANQYIDPGNDYLLHTQQMGWKILTELLDNKSKYSKTWIL